MRCPRRSTRAALVRRGCKADAGTSWKIWMCRFLSKRHEVTLPVPIARLQSLLWLLTWWHHPCSAVRRHTPRHQPCPQGGRRQRRDAVRMPAAAAVVVPALRRRRAGRLRPSAPQSGKCGGASACNILVATWKTSRLQPARLRMSLAWCDSALQILCVASACGESCAL